MVKRTAALSLFTAHPEYNWDVAAETISRWIDTTGGPLILMPESLVPLWKGVSVPMDGRVVEAKFRFSHPEDTG